jgi:hypothetical protein
MLKIKQLTNSVYIFCGRLCHHQELQLTGMAWTAKIYIESANSFVCDAKPSESLIFVIIMCYLETTPKSNEMVYNV